MVLKQEIKPAVYQELDLQGDDADPCMAIFLCYSYSEFSYIHYINQQNALSKIQ
jgi:hypothetical protein